MGIAQIAIGPPLRCQTGTLWHLFSGKIMQMPVCTWTFLLKIGATNHPGKGLDPPPQTGNAQMNRDFFSVGLPLTTLYPFSFFSEKLTSLAVQSKQIIRQKTLQIIHSNFPSSFSRFSGSPQNKTKVVRNLL